MLRVCTDSNFAGTIAADGHCRRVPDRERVASRISTVAQEVVKHIALRQLLHGDSIQRQRSEQQRE
jgi:hypothetical protein